MKKKRKTVSGKQTKPLQRDSALEEHIKKILEKETDKKAIKDSIEAVVKKDKPETKAEKSKKGKEKKSKGVYGRTGKDEEYRGLKEAGIYNQVVINPFVGFVYKSNIKENSEFYEHLSYKGELKAGDELGEKNLASDRMMDEYAVKFSLNFLVGTNMNDISVEEKELMFFNLYDQSLQHIYLAKVAILGFGYNNTILKTMHALPDAE